MKMLGPASSPILRVGVEHVTDESVALGSGNHPGPLDERDARPVDEALAGPEVPLLSLRLDPLDAQAVALGEARILLGREMQVGRAVPREVPRPSG
jgi:hypothetical protein